MLLNISDPATASLSRVTSLEQQEASLKGQLSTETNQVYQLEGTVNSECNGSNGKGLTGVFGNGPACHQDQQDVLNYESTHPMRVQNAQLANIVAQIKSEQGVVSGQQASYQTAVSQAIGKRVAQETPPSDPIGMAERFQALAYLSTTNSFISIASWFVRIFFILIDCLPVLVKFISGSTPYDTLVDDEIISAEKQFKSESDTRDAVAEIKNGVALKKAKAEAARQIKEINFDVLRQDAERGNLKEDEVDALWRRKLSARRAAGAGDKRSPDSSGQPFSSFDVDNTGSQINGSSRRADRSAGDMDDTV
jgi:hypothetical protein